MATGEHNEQLYIKKFEELGKIDKFFERHT